MKRAIIIMAKVPATGTVKTRLHPFLSPEKCAELAWAFLRDAETKAKIICENTILAYAPADRKNVLENALRGANTLVEQVGATLGERMTNAFEFAFRQDLDAVLMIGTDSPTVSAAFFKMAFELLERDADVVLGKTADGGFYAVGLGKNQPRLFENVAWSSERVFRQTARNTAQLKLRLAQIPESFDVDAPSDLISLRAEMFADATARRHAPQTYKWLLSNSNLFV
jgi:rSAM/selenodomain-associated transferase 1